MNFIIRRATTSDIPVLTELIQFSARELGKTFYTPEQIEGALQGAWGVDTQLIKDGTFFAVLDGDRLAGCGGWSKRKALFGADSLASGEPELLKPGRDSARIRAFFVHPQWARHGIGRMLLNKCEGEARTSGFTSAELVATLPGEQLYAACGYRPVETIDHSLPNGISIRFVRMRKECLA